MMDDTKPSFPPGFPSVGGYEPVGSRVTCDPYPMDTDVDYLILVAPWDLKAASLALEEAGWERGGSRLEGTRCTSWKSLVEFANEPECQDMTVAHCVSRLINAPIMVNFLVTSNKQFFDDFLCATHVAKQLNLLDKRQRICLFQAILYGNRYDIPTITEEELDDPFSEF